MGHAAQTKQHSNLRVLTAPTKYSDLSDRDLIIACQTRNEGAFNELYKRNIHLVRGALNRMASDMPSVHDDLVQEAFIRVWKSIGTLKNPGVFKSWLNQIVTNLFYDELRKRPKERVVSFDEPLKNSDGEESGTRDLPADATWQPDYSFEANENVTNIATALSQLPKKFKDPIVLREVHGLSYEEIANVTHTELGTVKSRIARAKSKMQSYLTDKCA